MCYKAVIDSSGGDEATLAKSFIISLKGKATNWYARLQHIVCDLTKCCHRFSSSGLNLAYEGLLLGASWRPQDSGPTQLSPRWIKGFVHDSRDHEPRLHRGEGCSELLSEGAEAQRDPHLISHYDNGHVLGEGGGVLSRCYGEGQTES
jgi:hypothetical protein